MCLLWLTANPSYDAGKELRLKGDIIFEFDQSEDVEQLFRFTTGLMPYKEVDNQWLEEKFGVKVMGDKTQAETKEDKDESVEKAIDKKLSAFFG